MRIEIPHEAASVAQVKAKADGFESVDAYVTHLILRRKPDVDATRHQALQRLKDLRAQSCKLSRQEIVDSIAAARTDLR